MKKSVKDNNYLNNQKRSTNQSNKNKNATIVQVQKVKSTLELYTTRAQQVLSAIGIAAMLIWTHNNWTDLYLPDWIQWPYNQPDAGTNTDSPPTETIENVKTHIQNNVGTYVTITVVTTIVAIAAWIICQDYDSFFKTLSNGGVEPQTQTPSAQGPMGTQASPVPNSTTSMETVTTKVPLSPNLETGPQVTATPSSAPTPGDAASSSNATTSEIVGSPVIRPPFPTAAEIAQNTMSMNPPGGINPIPMEIAPGTVKNMINHVNNASDGPNPTECKFQ